MKIERTNSTALVFNQLPDGSRILIDPNNETIFALDATAGAAWDACSDPTTLSAVTEQMQHCLKANITEDKAEEAILQLEEKNLLKTSGSSRRQFMKNAGIAALPLVASLTVADQRALAQSARSGAPASSHPNPVQPAPGGPQDPFSPSHPGPRETFSPRDFRPEGPIFRSFR